MRAQDQSTKPFPSRARAGTTPGLVKHGSTDAPPPRRRLKPPLPWYAQAVWDAADLGCNCWEAGRAARRQGGCVVGGALCQIRHHGVCGGDGKRQHARRASSERSRTVGGLGRWVAAACQIVETAASYGRLLSISGTSRLDAMGVVMTCRTVGGESEWIARNQD
jgi:hypothetical protein